MNTILAVQEELTLTVAGAVLAALGYIGKLFIELQRNIRDRLSVLGI